MKSLFDDDYLTNCADINGIGITTIIPNVFYIINWCKLYIDGEDKDGKIYL